MISQMYSFLHNSELLQSYVQSALALCVGVACILSIHDHIWTYSRNDIKDGKLMTQSLSEI